MKLKDWFTNLSEQSLSDKEKAAMYARILQGAKKTEEKHFFTKRMEFYLRVGTLTALLIGAGVYFFTGYIPQNLDTTISDNQVVTINDNSKNNIVQADTLGKLINVEGSIEIFDGNRKIENVNGLVSGNTVHLKDGARVEVVVRQGVKAIITGPAVFTLERLEDGDNSAVVLNLIEGSYFEIVPIQTAEQNVFNEEEKKEEERLVVKTQDFEIQQMPAQRDMRVKVTKDKKGVATLENQGADIIVKRIGEDNDNSELTVIGHDQIAMVDRDVVRVDREIDQSASDKLEKQLKDKQLTIRYESDSDIITVPNDNAQKNTEKVSGSNASAGSTASSSTADPAEESKNEMTIAENSNTKRVLEKSTTEQLQKIMAIGFVRKHTKDIAVYHAAGIEDKKSVAIHTLSEIVNRARGIVDLGPVDSSINAINSGYEELYAYFNREYYISPSLNKTIEQNRVLIQTMTRVPADIYESNTFSYQSVVEFLAEEGFSF